MLMVLPFMLGWPWVKIFLNERAAARRAAAEAARGEAEGEGARGGAQLL
jgi:hypothetical protein